MSLTTQLIQFFLGRGDVKVDKKTTSLMLTPNGSVETASPGSRLGYHETVAETELELVKLE
jgi:hypothetical protein